MAYPAYIVINIGQQVPALPPGPEMLGPTLPPQPWGAEQNLPPGPPSFGPPLYQRPRGAQQNLPHGPPLFGPPLHQQPRVAQQNLPPGPPFFGPPLYPQPWGAHQQNLPPWSNSRHVQQPSMGPQYQPYWSSNREQFQSTQAAFNRQPRRQGPGPQRRRRPNPRQRRRRQEERQHQENVSIVMQANGRIQRERRNYSSSRWTAANESLVHHHAAAAPSQPEPVHTDDPHEDIEVLETFPPSARGGQYMSQWPVIIRGAARRQQQLSDADHQHPALTQ